MNTETLIKAAIIESQAVSALQLADDDTFTSIGKVALHNMAAAHAWSVSVLTAEPLPIIKARIRAAAADHKPLNQYRPRLVS